MRQRPPDASSGRHPSRPFFGWSSIYPRAATPRLAPRGRAAAAPQQFAAVRRIVCTGQPPGAPGCREQTVNEVDRLTGMRAVFTFFVLGEDPRLAAFVDNLARRCGGRVVAPSLDGLGAEVVSDYLFSVASEHMGLSDKLRLRELADRFAQRLVEDRDAPAVF